MRRGREQDQLEQMLDATVDALLQRASAEAEVEVSFGVGDSSTPPEVEELWQMLQLAQEPERLDVDPGAVSFAAGDTDDSPQGLLARLHRESTELIEGVISSLASPHVIESGEGQARIRTRMGWLGDTTIHATPHLSSDQIAAHVAATDASLAASADRMRLVTMVLGTASKIATAITTPRGALMALPIAYKCVRDVRRRWSARNAGAAA